MATPLTTTDPAELANLSRCFSSCVPIGLHTSLRTFQLNNVAVIVTQPGCTPPGVPTITAGQVLSDTSIRIKWSKPTSVGSFIKGYEIQYGTTSGGPYPFVVDRPPTPRQFDVPDLSPGTTYYFVIQSIGPNAACRSAFSGESSFTTSGSPAVCATGTTFASAWAAQVVVNGGANPSAATQLAIATFQCGLISDGLDTSMIMWNAFAADSLIAARTPQLAGSGNVLWANNNFIGGDLTASGLTGDGATKYLDTVADPIGGATAMASCGTVIYTPVIAASVNGRAFGTLNLGFLLSASKDNTGNAFGAEGSNPSGVITTPSQGAGYYSNQRINVNDHRLFFAKGAVAHAQIGATDVGGLAVGLPAQSFFVFCLNNGGAAFGFTAETLGFVGITKGLTAAQSASLFARVQTLMTAFGRQV